jgi:hypothetical protein
LLLALGVRLFTVLISSLRMLLGGGRLLFALCMIALAVMFGGGTVSLCGVLVVLCSLVMLVSCHGRFLGYLPATTNSFLISMVPSGKDDQMEMFLTEAREALYAGHENPVRNLEMSKMPPIPPGNQSRKGPKRDAEAERDTSKGHQDIQNHDQRRFL